MNSDCDNSLIGSWGYVISEDFVLMEDRERFINNRMLGVTMICEDEFDEYIITRCKDELFHVEKDKFSKRETPLFVWGDLFS